MADTIKRNHDNNEKVIFIPIYDFMRLNKKSDILDLFIHTLWKSARLSYNQEKLTFDDALVEPLMMILFPAEYDNKLNSLKQAKEEEND